MSENRQLLRCISLFRRVSAWLVSTEFPRLSSQASSPVILKSATFSQSTLLSSSPSNPAHKKTEGLQKQSVHILREE